MSLKTFRYLIVAGLLAGAISVIGWMNLGQREKATPSQSEASIIPDQETERISHPREKAPSRWKSLEDNRVPVSERVSQVLAIPETISAEEFSGLLAALRKQVPDDEQERWWLISNEILKKLRSCPASSELYTDSLCGLIEDPRVHEVLRDYAVQHLCQWLAPAKPGAKAENNSLRIEKGLGMVVEAIRNPENQHTSIPGTALMALQELTAREGSISPDIWKQLEAYLTDVTAGRMSASTSNQISAIQISGMRKIASSHETIRKLAMDQHENPSLRLASISALGLYGSEVDRPFLESLASSGEKFQFAARAALDRYSQNP